MFIRELNDCPEFTAGDNCTLREILHPDKTDLELRYSLAHAVVKPERYYAGAPPAYVGSLLYYGRRGHYAYRRQIRACPSRLDDIHPSTGETVHCESWGKSTEVHLHRGSRLAKRR